MSLSFAFLFMELRAIDHDRALYTAEQACIRKRGKLITLPL